MTRFARAKGSKASNERAPEDATPWAVMKEQLQRAKDDAEHSRLREQAEKQRLENYENFLNEQKTAKRKSTWCEFPGETPEQASKQRKKNKLHHPSENETTNSLMQIKKKKEKNKIYASQNENEKHSADAINSSETVALNKKKKKSLKQSMNSENAETAQYEIQNKTSKTKMKKIMNKESAENEQSEDVNQELNEIVSNNIVQQGKKKQKQKNKSKLEIPSLQADSEPYRANQENSYFEKRKSLGRNTTETEPESSHAKQKKKSNLEKGSHTRRKKEGDRSFELIINGRAVELVKYDSFPVMKKDADRLEDLKKSMMTKGIPKSEVLRTIKLERRRAEKALARLKRDVCYNCRKGGHNLSDCPELRNRLEPRGSAEPGVEGAADGVCFKCGSTEHRAFDCRVQKSQDYKFASCFICKEQGHIARQCPDNPRGLYPNGGACRLCGDVTHLRKDCPTTSTEKVEASVRLETLASSDAVEEISQRATNAASATTNNKKTKKIKF